MKCAVDEMTERGYTQIPVSTEQTWKLHKAGMHKVSFQLRELSSTTMQMPNICCGKACASIQWASTIRMDENWNDWQNTQKVHLQVCYVTSQKACKSAHHFILQRWLRWSLDQVWQTFTLCPHVSHWTQQPIHARILAFKLVLVISCSAVLPWDCFIISGFVVLVLSLATSSILQYSSFSRATGKVSSRASKIYFGGHL